MRFAHTFECCIWWQWGWQAVHCHTKDVLKSIITESGELFVMTALTTQMRELLASVLVLGEILRFYITKHVPYQCIFILFCTADAFTIIRPKYSYHIPIIVMLSLLWCAESMSITYVLYTTWSSVSAFCDHWQMWSSLYPTNSTESSYD